MHMHTYNVHALAHTQLTVVMRAELENDGVRVLTERLTLQPGITDTRGVVQQLNVGYLLFMAKSMFSALLPHHGSL